jgi:peptidoglycan hydrolase CwlO-like protein
MSDAALTVGELMAVLMGLITFAGMIIGFSKTSNQRAKEQGQQEEINKNVDKELDEHQGDINSLKHRVTTTERRVDVLDDNMTDMKRK